MQLFWQGQSPECPSTLLLSAPRASLRFSICGRGGDEEFGVFFSFWRHARDVKNLQASSRLSYHHFYLIDSQAKTGRLEAGVVERLQQGSVVNSLVEVVAPHFWRVLRYWYRLPIDVFGFVHIALHLV